MFKNMDMALRYGKNAPRTPPNQIQGAEPGTNYSTARGVKLDDMGRDMAAAMTKKEDEDHLAKKLEFEAAAAGPPPTKRPRMEGTSRKRRARTRKHTKKSRRTRKGAARKAK